VRRQSLSAAVRFKSIEKSSDLTGIRTRDLLTYSIVSETAALPCVFILVNYSFIVIIIIWRVFFFNSRKLNAHML
jgi:hypothetical protein